MSCRVINASVMNNGELHVTVILTPTPSDGRVMFLAAPPCERRSSFTGSCLPFPSEQHALERTPNRGIASSKTDRFTCILPKGVPGVYHSIDGFTLLPPMLHVVYKSNNRSLNKCSAPIFSHHPFVYHRSSVDYHSRPFIHKSIADQETLFAQRSYMHAMS